MTAFNDVQRILDRVLGSASAGNHKAFWRGVTRDQFVALSVFGMKVVVVGNPAASNLVKALKGAPPFGFDLTPKPPGAIFPRMPKGLPPATAEEIAQIEAWIAAGAPETAPPAAGPAATLVAVIDAPASDDDHVTYWREIDLFFLPGLASPETQAHVGRMHAPGFTAWAASALQGAGPEVWAEYQADPENAAAFEYVRLHQRRLINTYYHGGQADVFESLWKFGGDLLPRDPHSGALPEHRMNGLIDWFIWIAYLDMSMSRADLDEVDLALARAWHVGICADGLLRTDGERTERLPIPEFDENDPDVRAKVEAAYGALSPDALITAMRDRARAFFN